MIEENSVLRAKFRLALPNSYQYKKMISAEARRRFNQISDIAGGYKNFIEIFGALFDAYCEKNGIEVVFVEVDGSQTVQNNMYERFWGPTEFPIYDVPSLFLNCEADAAEGIRAASHNIFKDLGLKEIAPGIAFEAEDIPLMPV